MPQNSDEYDLFVSYARSDNREGWIRDFVSRLQEEHRAYSNGRDFRIFFDTSAIRSLDDWQHRIYGGLAASRLLLAFISPAYLASKWCREEWRTWVDVEIAKHVLSEGAATIYIVETPWLNMTEEQVAQELAQLSGTPSAHDVKNVAAQISRRQLTKVLPFFSAGLEALRREDLRKILIALAEDLAIKSDRVEAALRSKSTIPPYNRRFVGRLDELTHLRHWLFRGRSGVITSYERGFGPAASAMVTVQGLGGIGKSELAFTYAHAYAGLYPGGRFLIPCENISDLRLGMLALDEVFHDHISDEQRKTLALHFGAVRDCLRNRLLELGRTLLVLDNVSEASLLLPEQIDQVKTLGPDLHVLSTTRLGAPERGEYDDAAWLTLGELSVEDGLRLLEKYRRFVTEAEQTAAEQIVRQLGGFALCIEVVGAYLNQHRDENYASFLEASGLSKLEYVDEAAAGSDVVTRRHNNEKRLGAILAATLKDLPPTALTVLRFASFLAPDGIPTLWLKALTERNYPEQVQDWASTVALLLSLALLVRPQGADGEAEVQPGTQVVVRCHRLVQSYVRGSLEASEENNYQRCIDDLVEERTAVLENAQPSDVRWELDPLDALAFLWESRAHPKAAWLMNHIGVDWMKVGDLAKAEPPLEAALAIREKVLGTYSPDMATSLTNLAAVYDKQGRYAEAEPLLVRALAIQEQLGPGRPQVAICLNNLAALHRKQGRFADAKPLLLRALQILESDSAFGPDHPDVAISLNNLGLLYRNGGLYSEAEALFKRALTIREKALGSSHPDVAQSLSNLALLYRDQGRPAEAEPLYRRALSAYENAFGPENADVAMVLGNLADLLADRADYAGAQPLQERALAIREKLLGAEHPHVALSLNSLGTLCFHQSRDDEAESLFSRALAIDEKGLGSDHPRVATSLNNLAAVYRSQGRLIEAEPLDVKALAITEKTLGPDHPSVAASLSNLAVLYFDQERYAEAEPLLLRALVIREKVFGPEHAELASNLQNLGALYKKQKDVAHAIMFYTRALEVLERSLGPEAPDILTILDNLGDLYYHRGRYTDAESLYERALGIMEKTIGPDNLNIATYLDKIAALYFGQNRYGEAQALCGRVLVIRVKVLGPNHPAVGEILTHLAAAYLKRGDDDGAAVLSCWAQLIAEEKLLPGHYNDLVAFLDNVAGRRLGERRYDFAEPLAGAILAIRENTLGPDHPEVASSLNALAGLYRDLGRYDEAEALYDRALVIAERVDPRDPLLARTLNNLAFLYFAEGRYAEAEPLMTRALEISEKTLGPRHAKTNEYRKGLETVRSRL